MSQKPIRILHVLGAMNRGGAETWLMHVLRHIDRTRFRMDFLVHTKDRAAFDEEIEAFGSAVIPCPDPRRPQKYARSLTRILHERGPYAIVHSHVHHYSGLVLRVARRAGVPVRIAHSHNDTALLDGRASLTRRIYLNLMTRWIRRHATLGLAASSKAAVSLFGSRWKSDPRWQLFFCAIDLEPFRTATDPFALRRELGIPIGALVLGHVGRFSDQKNHAFLLEIVAAVLKLQPATRILLVGDGPLRTTIQARAISLGLSENALFAGVRADVPRLMTSTMDVFLLPSLFEGLPLVLLEAQAAGLPCIFSDVIADEADVVQPLIHRVPLSSSAEVWAREVIAAANRPTTLPKEDALDTIARTPFNVPINVLSLQNIYASVMPNV